MRFHLEKIASYKQYKDRWDGVVDPAAHAPAMSMAMSPRTSSSSSSGTPPGTDECSDIIFGMADCVPFMTDGSKDMRPDGSCCPGLEMVLKASDDCICEAIESCTDLGIPLNMTKTMTLPAACGISAPNSFSQCGIPLPPGVSVKPTPKSSPKSPSPKRAMASSDDVVPAPSSFTAPTRRLLEN
ncbi:Bifunctional inhibitor/lipid-transfer protein/seed storage 2S albumin superfamily protein [Prunus dulcis]|uniref:Bifunctional inhibitor/lipid-transfer protein/seed storage 2S albumin superfamily protein n=1 Tax=Prunus dulcis TaxID=3755 RepID=A0A4Y1RHA5_PRUDU|nr:Bifunctional inhibitor/lipid-transfer protein/seed storage 2S albumin superfamily protein [Prunus dulcis]